jgi:hypothetical protein
MAPHMSAIEIWHILAAAFGNTIWELLRKVVGTSGKLINRIIAFSRELRQNAKVKTFTDPKTGKAGITIKKQEGLKRFVRAVVAAGDDGTLLVFCFFGCLLRLRA